MYDLTADLLVTPAFQESDDPENWPTASGRVFESEDGPWLVYIGSGGSDLLQWRPDVTGDGVLDLFVNSYTNSAKMLIFSGASLFPP
ncbi:MAG: hypothetical protein EXR71_00250 [Myxococcales bacterium]|nr:hypothetical protein [Myxococcales bacterium]